MNKNRYSSAFGKGCGTSATLLPWRVSY